MAKKASRKLSKLPKFRPGKDSAKKSPAKKPAARRTKAAKPNAGPRAITTGKGLSALEIGKKLVSDCNAGKWQLNDALWSKDIVSVEGMGASMSWHGRKAVDEKNAWWSSTHKIHGGSAEGPYVGATGFAVKFVIDVEDTATGQHTMMTEVGVYTVQDGKIVREEFMYSAW